MVMANPITVSVHNPSINAKCAQVIVTPLTKSIVVLRMGTLKGLNTRIIEGGHEHPKSKVVINLVCQNLQKKALKNIASEVMKRVTPARKPISTAGVWCP